jgi:hypothetical protein
MPQWQELLDAVHDQQPVSGLTHNFYRYPARFAPSFARQMILAFTKPGDLVIDPFMGGATTLVEAAALGRRAAGTDISSLAVFLAQAKTMLMGAEDFRNIRRWNKRLVPRLNLHNPRIRPDDTWVEGGYQRNISSKNTWPIRKLLELALAHVKELKSETERKFARCVLLRTAQWALDCRSEIPSASEVRQHMGIFLEELIEGAREFEKSVRLHSSQAPETMFLHRSAIGIEQESAIRDLGAPALVLTSPPYPGLHVLYHRWQVQGRRETPAPFWLAGTLDGAGASFYTFGHRAQKDLSGYYEKALRAFSSVAKIVSKTTLIVQMVAFGDPKWQLPAYLEMMEEAGFREKRFPQLANAGDGRVWREVPNRKWYADHKGPTGGSTEAVFFHRLCAK